MRDVKFTVMVESPDNPTPYKNLTVHWGFKTVGDPTPEEEDEAWETMQSVVCKILNRMCKTVWKWGVNGDAAKSAVEGVKIDIAAPREAPGI